MINQDQTVDNLDNFHCPVCLNHFSQSYFLAQCRHSFCQQCSISYITSQANNFAQAKCLQEGCGSSLDKTLPIYSFLEESVKTKLQFFESYKFLQNHPDHSSCKMKDCSGIFKISNGKCPLCQTKHCKKCLNLYHVGACVQSQQQKQMKKLKYQKCPACRVWVQKIQGCAYISCKCGMDFCHRCGHEFVKDPCRKRQLWDKEYQIRVQMARIPNIFKCTPIDVILLLPKLLVMVPMVLFLILFIVVIPMIVILAGFFILATLTLPFAFCQYISQMEDGCCKCMTIIVFVLCLPGLYILSAITYILAVMFYPCLRATYHHGIYDGLDKTVAKISCLFLEGVNCLFSFFDQC